MALTCTLVSVCRPRLALSLLLSFLLLFFLFSRSVFSFPSPFFLFHIFFLPLSFFLSLPFVYSSFCSCFFYLSTPLFYFLPSLFLLSLLFPLSLSSFLSSLSLSPPYSSLFSLFCVIFPPLLFFSLWFSSPLLLLFSHSYFIPSSPSPFPSPSSLAAFLFIASLLLSFSPSSPL